MTKKQANMKSCLQPMPKVLVSCRGLNGENNVLAGLNIFMLMQSLRTFKVI